MIVGYRRIGLIGAMNEEIALYLNALRQTKSEAHAGIEFHQGLLFGCETVLCRSGVGKVNAAVCTQILIDRYKVDAVLFTGVAGALHPDLNIGDIVISSESLQHDMDVTALGFPRGTIPYEKKSIFEADPFLMELAYSASIECFPGTTLKGRVLSGDQFIADRDTVRTLHEQLNGACTEMEGAAVAQVCSMNDVPYVIIRSMSDKADGSASINFAEFTIEASQNSYHIIEEMVKRLNRQHGNE